MKIGLYGGSFNPVHIYHLYIAKEALIQLKLDQVWFIPVFQPVHKRKDDLLNYNFRLDLLQTAINSYFAVNIRDKFVVSDLETKIEGPCYTYNLVQYCYNKFPNYKFYKIIGSDSLYDLQNWYNSSQLCKIVPFIIAPRDESHTIDKLPNSKSSILNIKPFNCSSSNIRKSLKANQFRNIYLLPSVIAKIVHNNFYDCLGDVYKFWITEIIKKIEPLEIGLKKHIYNVAILASEIAYKLNLDPRDGYLAGLAHDLFRLSDNSIIMMLASKISTNFLDEEYKLPMLAHGKASAAYLASISPTPPYTILEAVINHTFPPETHTLASPLTKVLVLADAFDPSRKDMLIQKIFTNHSLSYDEKYDEVVKYKKIKAKGFAKAV